MDSNGTQDEPSSDSIISAPPKSTQYYVCIGCSAGGLAVLETIIPKLPFGQGVCYIVIMHLNPDTESYAGELLNRHSSLPVIKAEHGMPAQAEKIYIIPPNTELTIHANTLVLAKRARMPIDGFLISLAEDQQERAIAVILTGAGSDGTVGIRHINENNGLVIVQDPGTAEFQGMPQSAQNTNLADIIAAPEDIPQHIQDWINKQGKLIPVIETAVLSPTSNMELQRIVGVLRSHSGHDFTLYKKNTLRRRIERRMIAQKMDSLGTYIRLLEAEPAECERLLKEILIGVTSFFRDPEAFEVLKALVIPQILQHVVSDKSLRIWIPGCSTGEEAYSIAMCVFEACQANPWEIELRIFASDIDKDSIEIAREGRYPKTIASELSPERLKNFFVEGVNDYRIKKELKERIIFAVHNAVRDPPFSKVDFISCRNLMIYLEPPLQQKLLRIFHYALNPGGMLFLGSSETTGDASNLFLSFEKKWKFFERKSTASFPNRAMDFEPNNYFTDPVPVERARAALPTPRKPSIRELSHEYLLSAYVPPSLICDNAGDILFIHGRMADYIETAPGEAQMNIFTMARDEIKLEISRGFQKVLNTNQAVRFADIKLRRFNELISIDIFIRPSPEFSYQQKILVISFETRQAEPLTPENLVHLDQKSIDEHTQNIERELLFTREHMQSLVEQLETSNEELKSMNEELQSSNEELQSSNEELETAKEELQAVNEELVTLNTELQIKIEELSTANNDLDNFLSSSSIATIFLNRHLLITRYSRSATRIFNLIPSDIGRSLGDFATQMKYDKVLVDAEEVLSILVPIERAVELKDGRKLFMRITPYKTAENVIDGVVIGFSDITEQNRIEQIAAMYQQICEKIPSMLLVFDRDQKIIFVNPECRKILGQGIKDESSATLRDFGINDLKIRDAILNNETVLSRQDWRDKIRLQVDQGSEITAEATIMEIRLSDRAHYLLILHSAELKP
ncbi:MAG TPA: CheR family methyltransferase [Oligoflexus sp.]|uniref:CheR family methyltransferase n=1 Tax=Oligoflexus sp. TaxID=1971216 RepID=UPI002D4758AC|nr:CheR family methyltransferase [Oligoflexus sp.]HYX37271.1 CheR family methyltransferase [Oligoflexus sp.]